MPRSHSPVKDRAHPAGASALSRSTPSGAFVLYCDGDVRCCSPRTKPTTSGCSGITEREPYVKDGINDYVSSAGNRRGQSRQHGTKVAAHYQAHDRRRTGRRDPPAALQRFAATEAQAFGKRVRPSSPTGCAKPTSSTSRSRRRGERRCRRVMRQALAGMLWSKQFYFFDGDNWLEEHHANPLHHGHRKRPQLGVVPHAEQRDIISMPDKWEYPWYAAWDLAFHTLPISIVDPDFAKEQMELMLRGAYLHPNGQIPAYEWNFSDVNPPVHAWRCTLFLHRTGRRCAARPTWIDFLKRRSTSCC